MIGEQNIAAGHAHIRHQGLTTFTGDEGRETQGKVQRIIAVPFDLHHRGLV